MWVSAELRRRLGPHPEIERALGELAPARGAPLDAMQRELCERLLELGGGNQLVETLSAQLERGEFEGVGLCSSPRAVSELSERCAEVLERIRRHRNAIITANTPVVVAIARRLHRAGCVEFSLQDLIQEGQIGLYEAIQRFDPRRGCRVSTHAAPWIRSAILQAYNKKSRLVRVPSYLLTAHRRASRWRRRFELLHGREPSAEEIAAATQLRPGVIERLSCFRPVAKVSLDMSVSGENSLSERLEDATPSPERWLEAVELAEDLREAFESLPELEAAILRRRFGLSGAEPESLRALGEVYSLSHERIRQLQARGIRRLREALEGRLAQDPLGK